MKKALIVGGLLTGVGAVYAVRTIKNGKSAEVARDVHFETSIAIDKSPAELFQFWRQFTNLALFMEGVESVDERVNGLTHWVVKGTGGTKFEWDAEIYNEIENELIAWRTVGDADIVNAGSVRFQKAPKGHGSYVRISMNYNSPVGTLGGAIAQLLGDNPEQLIRRDLKRFKQLMETEELATIEGQSSGRLEDQQPALKARAATMGSAPMADRELQREELR